MKAGKQKSKFAVGDIVLVNFPFQEDPSKSKQRPALVIELQAEKLKLIPITSQVKYRGLPCYIELQLFKTSFINVCREILIDQDLVMATVEMLSRLQLSLVMARYNALKK